MRNPTLGVVMTALAVVGSAAITSVFAQTPRELFPGTKDQGRAAVEYQDDDLHVVAAYYHSQRNHDSRWLLLEVAVEAFRPMRINREDIVLRSPDGREIPVASQRDYRTDYGRTQALIQNASTSRHGIGGYFTAPGSRNFKFFAQPFEGIVYSFFDADTWRVAFGDLFFASPTGAWEDGTYSLVVNGADGAQAMLPIELE